MKKHIIIYGLTQSGLQTASSLIETALSSTYNTCNLGSYFKISGDRYLSHDENAQLVSHSKLESAIGQPFIQTYRKSESGIVSYFDYAVSRLRKPEEELQHRLRLLQEDETDNIYISNLSAFHEGQLKIPLENLLRIQESEVIVLDPRMNLRDIAKHFFAAHQSNIWTSSPEKKIKLKEDISFDQKVADKFNNELQLLKTRLSKINNMKTVKVQELDSPSRFLNSLDLNSNSAGIEFQDAQFEGQWKPSDLTQFNRWMKSLDV